jgi:hypothetical protein
MTKRPYREFPNIEVLKYLLAGNGYRATAEKFGYLDPDSHDPTKRFRTLLRHKRNKGFEHERRVVHFPEFDREGRVIGKLTPFIKSLVPVIRRKPAAKKSEVAKVKLLRGVRGRLPENTLGVVVDLKSKRTTLWTMNGKTTILTDDLYRILGGAVFMQKPKKDRDLALLMAEES